MFIDYLQILRIYLSGTPNLCLHSSYGAIWAQRPAICWHSSRTVLWCGFHDSGWTSVWFERLATFTDSSQPGRFSHIVLSMVSLSIFFYLPLTIFLFLSCIYHFYPLSLLSILYLSLSYEVKEIYCIFFFKILEN